MTALLKFPHKQREQSPMSERFVKGFVQSSQLYRKEVYPFLSDAARHVYFELENRLNGFQKNSDSVSYSQLQGDSSLVGARTVARATVAKGLKELVEHGVITVLSTSKRGNKYQINEVSLFGKQYSKKTSASSELVQVVDQSSLLGRPQLVHVVDTQKKPLNKSIKESSSNSEKPFFEAQKNVLAGYVTYFSNDPKYYSLHELELTYAVGSDFINQAQASHPSLELSIDHFSQMFDDMRQWSLTPNSGTKQPQQWMNTWLKWVKNNSYKFTAKPKNQPQTNQTKPKQQREQAWADYYSKRNQQQPSMIDVIEVQHD